MMDDYTLSQQEESQALAKRRRLVARWQLLQRECEYRASHTDLNNDEYFDGLWAAILELCLVEEELGIREESECVH